MVSPKHPIQSEESLGHPLPNALQVRSSTSKLETSLPTSISDGQISERSQIDVPLDSAHQQPPRLQRWLSRSTRWQQLNLQTKTTILALVIGVVPIVMIGTVAYYFSNQSLTKQVLENEKDAAVNIEDKFEFFIKDRVLDTRALAENNTFANPQISAVTTQNEKNTLLTQYTERFKFYDRIAVLDTKGNVLAQSKSTEPLQGNYSALPHFQQALKTQSLVITEPFKSQSSGNLSVEFIAPIKSQPSGQLIGFVRSRMPVSILTQLFDVQIQRREAFYLIDSSDNIFLSAKNELLGQSLQTVMPNLYAQKQAKKNLAAPIATTDAFSDTPQVVAYAPLKDLQDQPYNLNWGAVASTATNVAFESQRQLLIALALGTGLAALIVGGLAALLARRMTHPIIAAAQTVAQIGQGQLDSRLDTGTGHDEVAILGDNINQMAAQLQALLQQQANEARRNRLYVAISRADESEIIGPLNSLLEEIRAHLQVDRVVVYRFNPDSSGYISGEAVLPDYPSALHESITDPCIAPELLNAYRQGRILPTTDVLQAGFHPDHLNLLERLKVRANLVTPLLAGQHLYGLLIAHHCTQPHRWNPLEIDWLWQQAIQIGQTLERLELLRQEAIARQQADLARLQAEQLAQQQRQQKETMQMQLLALLNDVEGATHGDLTVRANITVGEIGTAADFFNAIVESLRRLVIQVQQSTERVNTSIGNNGKSVQLLADQALSQATEITHSLEFITQMTHSIEAIAKSAQQAAEIAHHAANTAIAGETAMSQTVDSITSLQQTVSTTTQKLSQLGDAAQSISRVVSLINQIAIQTDLLAINTGIEAARAGAQGQGFAIVAKEVSALAAQATEATKDIEHLVNYIQQQTVEALTTMEQSTVSVAQETTRIEATKAQMQDIVGVSQQIDQVLQFISSTTTTQTTTAQNVTYLMQSVAHTAEQTSAASNEIAQSLQQSIVIAQQLQASVNRFKVKPEGA
jgi:methyl-accepting chemotaxis protein PixJ